MTLHRTAQLSRTSSAPLWSSFIALPVTCYRYRPRRHSRVLPRTPCAGHRPAGDGTQAQPDGVADAPGEFPDGAADRWPTTSGRPVRRAGTPSTPHCCCRWPTIGCNAVAQSCTSRSNACCRTVRCDIFSHSRVPNSDGGEVICRPGRCTRRGSLNAIDGFRGRWWYSGAPVTMTSGSDEAPRNPMSLSRHPPRVAYQLSSQAMTNHHAGAGW